MIIKFYASQNHPVDNFGTRLLVRVFGRFFKNCIYLA